LQLDGGITFTEPTAIICGQVEGMSDVSGLMCKFCCAALYSRNATGSLQQWQELALM
jgi:hypothetical protein